MIPFLVSNFQRRVSDEVQEYFRDVDVKWILTEELYIEKILAMDLPNAPVFGYPIM